MKATGGRVLSPVRLCAVSFGWGCLASGAGVWFPGYRSITTTCRPGGGCSVTESASTLVDVNGNGVLLWLAVPIAASVLVGGLVVASARAGAWSHVLAWCVVGALWVVSVLSIASVGLFFVPSAVLLSIAAAVMREAGQTPTGVA